MADEKPSSGVDPQILKMWRENGRLYAIAGLLVGLALGVIILPAIGSLENAADVQVFLNDLAPELVGILITVLVIERLNERRSKREAIEALKRQLVMDAGSQSNEKAKDAVHQMRNREWLTGEDGLLKGSNLARASLEEANLAAANLQNVDLSHARLQNADLRWANLQRANLRWANLQRAQFYETNLQDAYMLGANLQRTRLGGTNLQRANLNVADMQNAVLSHADLRGAILNVAKLQGVDFSWANLLGATLLLADFDEATILPDEKHWTSETDMRYFTDPSFPGGIWRSDNPVSPAYRGDSEA